MSAMKRLHEQRAPGQYRNGGRKRRLSYRTRERLIDGSLWALLAVGRIAMCIGIALAVTVAGKEIINYAHRPPSIGQDIGGGIHTTCHGTDRIYTSSTGLAVIHNDSSCDSGG